jgi:pimeloyl-ACP methyl ester carboxylesterase
MSTVGLARFSSGRFRAVAGLAVVALLGAAAWTAKKDDLREPTSQPVFTSAACPEPSLPNVAPLGPEFSCGYLTVPENRDQPDGRQIQIAVARLKAASPEPDADPIVWLTGGPGGSGLLDASSFAAAKPAVNADRDVIFVDQRGTGHSEPSLTCPEIDAFTHESATLVSTSADEASRRHEAVLACRTRLAGEGYDLAAYNTTENAADIADLRTALGIDDWNVYGVSYGTDLALQLLRDHPQGIRSVILDGVVPPHLNLIDGLWQGAADEYAAVFAACEAQPACHAAFPNLRTEFTETVRRLDGEPLTVDVPATADAPATTVVLDGYRTADVPVVFSVPPWGLANLPATIHALATGDGTAAARTILAGQSPPDFIGWGLLYGVICREHAALTDPGKVLTAAKAALPDFPDRTLSLQPQEEFVGDIFNDCAAWDVPAADPAVATQTRSDVPVLLMSGGFDAATAPRYAAAAAAGLPNSRQLLFPGLGHAVVFQSECARATFASFFDQPAGGYDTSCVAALTVPPFSTP